MRKLNIVVIGAGMYTCGTGTDGYGTIMPAISEWKKTNGVGEVYVVGRSIKTLRAAGGKIRKLSKMTGVNIPVSYFPRIKDDGSCFREAVRMIPRPACAIVAVPDNMHKEVAKTAIENGLHTLVVKPLVSKTADAADLIKLQRKKKVYCAVEFHKRLDMANLKLRDAIRKGLIGDPLYFVVEFSQRKSIPSRIFKNWIRSTNVFQYLGIHYADIIYWATGALPKRVMALGQKNWLYSKGLDTYDSIEAIIEWEVSGKKFVSCIMTNWIDPEDTSAMSDQAIKVIGTRGRFESDQKRRGITIVTDDGGVEEPNPYFSSAYGESGRVSYRGYGIDSICRFLDDVRDLENGIAKTSDLENMRPTFTQALASTSVLEAVNKSLAMRGRWIEIGRFLHQ